MKKRLERGHGVLWHRCLAWLLVTLPSLGYLLRWLIQNTHWSRARRGKCGNLRGEDEENLEAVEEKDDGEVIEKDNFLSLEINTDTHLIWERTSSFFWWRWRNSIPCTACKIFVWGKINYILVFYLPLSRGQNKFWIGGNKWAQICNENLGFTYI